MFLSYSQPSSSRQNYTGSTIGHLAQSSSSRSGTVDEYGDQQQVLYGYGSSYPLPFTYETTEYTTDGMSSNTPVLTEEILLRSHADNDGKFPTHLLTKLGSRVYDMPSDQVEWMNNGKRITTTTTTTRYYTLNPGETGYESAVDETNESSPRYTEEKFFQIQDLDSKDLLSNYDIYSKTGEKLEGEQLNF